MGFPSSGVWSILKSPVWRIDPNGVSIATAIPSGIEWVTRKNRIENGPTLASPGTSTGRRSARSSTPCSASFPSRSPSVKGVP